MIIDSINVPVTAKIRNGILLSGMKIKPETAMPYRNINTNVPMIPMIR